MSEKSEPTLASLDVLNVRLGGLHDDVAEMRKSLRQLTDAITKLYLVEQQQTQTTQAIERCFRAIEKIEDRLALLESQLPVLSKTSVWTERGVLALAGAALMYVAKKLGLFP